MELEAKPEILISDDSCPECGGLNIVYDYNVGETICKDCGLVIQDLIIDRGPEWRIFSQEDKDSKIRVGAPISYCFNDKGLATSIGDINHDAHGRKLPFQTRLKMMRLKRWHIRSRVSLSIYRNLSKAMSELDRLSDKLYVPKFVKEKAALIYRRALDKGLIQGRSITAIVAASLYAACRTTDIPRSLREVSEASITRQKDVARCYRLLIRELGIHASIAKPITFLSKIAEKANVSDQTQLLASKILKDAKEKGLLSGRDPRCMAAIALYIACKRSGEKKTQKCLAEAAGVTEVALRNRYRNLKKELKVK